MTTTMITTKDKVVTDILAAASKKRELELDDKAKIRENWARLKAAGFEYSDKELPPVVLDYDEGRMLYDILPDGAWKGQRCFIIGGGDSLKDFDFSRLKNELVIGVNRAFEKIDCTINFAMDHQLFDWITRGRLGENAQKKFENYKGFPVWLDSAGYDYPKGIFVLSKSGNNTISYSMNDGLGGATNSGFGALNLAVCLGANPIYLLGFDMKGNDGKQSWWHEGYPDRPRGDKIYKMFINDFKRVSSELRSKGIDVINLNPESMMKGYEFGRFEDIKPIKRPIFSSYYTIGTAYEKQVESLKASLRRFNLDYDIEGIPDLGNWYKNTYCKSKFVVKMMKKHADRSIVFVDADAKIRKSPVLFNDLDCDFAYHNYNRKELLGGTLYFNNTKGGRYMAKKWLEIDQEKLTTLMPQKNLQTVFNLCKDKIRWSHLPIEYCMIFDCRARRRINPVIEHFQMSRQQKDSHQKKTSYKLKPSLLGIKRLCKGKRICLIGNAQHVLQKKRKIESYDIVCRMNRGKPQGKEALIGKRTDILFLSTGLSRKSIEDAFNPHFTVWMTVCHRLAHPWVLRNGIQNPIKDWNELQKMLGMKPSTGLMSLNFLLKHIEFKTLSIYGFDFFATKSWYNTKVDNGKKHSGKKEKVVFMEMIKNRPNVRLIQ